MASQTDYRKIAASAAIWLGFAALLFLAWKAASVLFIIFAGLLVALIFSGAADLIEKIAPWPRWVSLIMTYVAVFSLVGSVFALAGTAVVLEFEELLTALKGQVSTVNDKLAQWGLIEKTSGQTSVLDFLPGSLSPVESVNNVARSVFGALGNFLVILFIGGFVSWNPKAYRRGIVSLFPKPRRERVDEAIMAATSDLGDWLKGQGLAMLSVFAASWFILWLIGMPYASALAIQAALLAFVQTIGPLIAGIAIVLVGLSVSASMALWGFAAYVFIQLVESNLTTPLIQREMSAIPPAMTLSCQLLFGALFGLLGLALAVPMLRVIMTLTQKLYVEDALGGYREDPSEVA